MRGLLPPPPPRGTSAGGPRRRRLAWRGCSPRRRGTVGEGLALCPRRFWPQEGGNARARYAAGGPGERARGGGDGGRAGGGGRGAGTEVQGARPGPRGLPGGSASGRLPEARGGTCQPRWQVLALLPPVMRGAARAASARPGAVSQSVVLMLRAGNAEPGWAMRSRRSCHPRREGAGGGGAGCLGISAFSDFSPRAGAVAAGEGKWRGGSWRRGITQSVTRRVSPPSRGSLRGQASRLSPSW